MTLSKDFRNYLVNNTSLMDNSIRLYVRTIRLFLIEYKGEITVENINKFITEHTRDKYSYYMKAPFKHFLEMMGTGEMFAKLKTPRHKPRKKTYNNIPVDMIVKVLNNIESPIFRLIAKIQFNTGSRAGDIIRIKKGYVTGNDKDGYRIRIVGKGGKERYTTLSTNLAKGVLLLEKSAKNKDGYIFLRTHSRDINRAIDTTYHYYWKYLRKAVKKIGVDFTTHYFRHKYIQDALNSGFDIFSIQRDIGHARIDTTINYLFEKKTTKEIHKKIRGDFDDV